MTDSEIRHYIHHARIVAAPVGPMHGWWDVISDAEGLLSGARTIVPRVDIEAWFREKVAEGRLPQYE